jgi:hypothetical protein
MNNTASGVGDKEGHIPMSELLNFGCVVFAEIPEVLAVDVYKYDGYDGSTSVGAMLSDWDAVSSAE